MNDDNNSTEFDVSGDTRLNPPLTALTSRSTPALPSSTYQKNNLDKKPAVAAGLLLAAPAPSAMARRTHSQPLVATFSTLACVFHCRGG